MSTLYVVLALVAVQRLIELAWARHNTRRLLAEGGIEHGAEHYPLFVALHAGWLGAMLVGIPMHAPANPWLLGVFGLLMAARLWVIVSLGRFWTTRIVTLPGQPLVRRGPYRFLRHPNYLVVLAEVAVLPLAFGALGIALFFSVINAALIAHRIRIEEQALAARRHIA